MAMNGVEGWEDKGSWSREEVEVWGKSGCWREEEIKGWK